MVEHGKETLGFSINRNTFGVIREQGGVCMCSCVCVCVCVCVCKRETEGERDRHKERQREREIEREDILMCDFGVKQIKQCL